MLFFSLSLPLCVLFSPSFSTCVRSYGSVGSKSFHLSWSYVIWLFLSLFHLFVSFGMRPHSFPSFHNSLCILSYRVCVVKRSDKKRATHKGKRYIRAKYFSNRTHRCMSVCLCMWLWLWLCICASVCMKKVSFRIYLLWQNSSAQPFRWLHSGCVTISVSAVCRHGFGFSYGRIMRVSPIKTRCAHDEGKKYRAVYLPLRCWFSRFLILPACV